MKRSFILMLLVFFVLGGLSGCILSTNPNPAIPITLKVGNSQAFTVSGFLNGPYAWYKNDTLIGGAAGATYTYYAETLDRGTNKIRVETRDLLNNKTLTKEWTVEVYYNLPPIANAGPDQNVYFGNAVYLDGSMSQDPELQPLVYLWSIVQRPVGSNATLNNPYLVNPSFTPDIEGAYTIRLIVNDGESNSASDAVVINSYTDFLPPTAEAGPDQTIGFPGVTAHLDGSLSSDPEGHALTYLWAIDSGPSGTGATLDDPESMTPSFMPDKKGVYVIRLVVNDGTFNSGVDWVNITVSNNAPVASAGDDITIPDFGGTANLDGSASSDPDGTDLTYTWTVTSRPGGSTAQIVNPSSATPTFTPDMKGGYIIKLVVSDGDFTAEDTVTVTYSNHVPVAEAGSPIVIPFTQTAQLNGSGIDPDGDPLTYAWTVTGRPAGSTANLSNANIYNPTFTPDKKGVYTFSLVVTDNDTPPLSSAPDTVTVTTTNHAPVANAGTDVNILNKHLVQLSGSGTDIDGDPLTYAWTIVSSPSGSGAALSNPNIANPTFTPDKKGFYTLSLLVFDGEAYSLADTMQINATNNAPVAEAGTNQTVRYANRMTQVNGNGSSDLDGDTVTYAWTVFSKPSGSTATLSSNTIMNPTITLDLPGTYVINLVVNDGTANSAIDTVTLTTYQENIVENWDDGQFSPWYESNRSGSWGNTGVDNEEPYSAPNSYWAQGAWFGGSLMINRNFTNTWLIGISFRFRGYATVIGSLKTSLYLNDSRYAGIWPDAGNTWYLFSYTPNMVVTKVGFYFDSFWGTDGAFIDDIVFTVWN